MTLPQEPVDHRPVRTLIGPPAKRGEVALYRIRCPCGWEPEYQPMNGRDSKAAMWEHRKDTAAQPSK